MMDYWEALVDDWCSPEWLAVRNKARDKRAQMQGVAHHEGSSNLFEYGDHWVCGSIHAISFFMLA